MKRSTCFSVLLSLSVALLYPGVASAQRDIDYDWMLGTIDILLQDLAAGFSYPLGGVDNDGNGIREEDSLAMLGSILRGGGRVSGLNSGMVAQILADFNFNRGAADNDLQAEGLNCTLLGVAGYPCKLTDILRMPGLIDGGDDLAELLLDFFGGLTTIADTPQTFNFINNYIDALVDAFASQLPPEIPPSLVDGLRQDLHLQSGNYYRWGSNGSGSPRFNALGANGNVDGDGATNYTEYQSAGTNREAWLTNCNIVPPIHITVHPVGGMFYTGDEVSLGVTFVGGSMPFTFQWQRAEDYPTLITITGATTQNLEIPYMTAAYHGWKPWLRISDPVTIWNDNAPGNPMGSIERDGYGGRTSQYTSPEIEVSYRTWAIRYQPSPGYHHPGEDFSTTFTVWGGTNVPTYQWYKDGEGAIAGQTTKTLSMTNLQFSDEGYYYCEATNDEGMLTSDLVFLGVRDPMSISLQPVGDNLAAGDDHTFTVTVADGHPPLSYQWYRANIGTPPGTGGSAVGPDSGTWLIEGLTGGQQGQYYCVITDMSGSSITSNTVELRVLSILQHPLPQDVRPGFPALFEIVILPDSGLPGVAPEYTYQWYVAYEEPVGVPQKDLLAGATNASYVIVNSLTGNPMNGGHEGDYTCIVTDSAPVSLESEIAPLTISADPIEFTVQPTGGRKYTGETHVFLVVATGGTGNAFTYQWYKDNVVLPGRNDFTFQIDPLDLDDTGIYRCEVGEDAIRPPLAYANTANVAIEVADPIVILEDPGDADLYEGETYTATVAISGGLGSQRYQWFKGAAPIPGATEGTFEIASAVVGDTGKYRCDVQDDRGVPLSTSFSWLNVYPALTIDTQPVGANVVPGDSHLFSVAASGGVGVLGYQWQKDGEDIGDDKPMLAIPSVAEDDDGTYTCIVSDSHDPAGEQTSSGAALNVEVYFGIPPSGQPQSAHIYTGANHTFTMYTVGADGSVSYQWYFDPDGAKVAAPIPGANTSALTITGADATNDGLYSLQVTDDMGTAGDPGDDVVLMSDSAQLLVSDHMYFSAQPLSQSDVPINGSVSIFVTVAGGIGTLSYQWQKDGADIPSATVQTLTIAPVEEDDEAAYACVVSDDNESATSDMATLTIALGVPVAGLAGLGALAGMVALAGATILRRRGK